MWFVFVESVDSQPFRFPSMNLLRIPLFFLALGASALSLQAAPVNDTYSGRIFLTNSNIVTTRGTNFTATNDPMPGGVGFLGGVPNGIWYAWTAPVTGTYDFNTNGSNYDTVLAVLVGGAQGAPEILDLIDVDDDDGDGLASKITADLVAGQTYCFVVGGYAFEDITNEDVIRKGDFVLNIRLTTPTGLADNIEDATVIGGTDFILKNFNNQAATREVGEPLHGADINIASVWMVYRSPIRGQVSLNFTGSGYRPAVAVYTSTELEPTVLDLTRVVETPRRPASTIYRPNGAGDNITFIAKQDEAYYIAVDGSVPKTGSAVSRGKIEMSGKFGLVAAGFDVAPTGVTVLKDTNATFTAQTGGIGVLTHVWERKPAGSTTWQTVVDGGIFSGATTTSLTITPASAAMNGDQFRLTVTDVIGSTTSAAATLTVTDFAPVSVASQGLASINISGGVVGGGRKYSASGLPAGLTMNAATGVISGRATAAPGTYRVVYWSMVGKVKTAERVILVTVDAFPATVAGRFEALVEDVNGFPTGKIEVSVTTTGSFTGKLTLNTHAGVLPLRGQLITNEDETQRVGILTVARPKLNSVRLNFSLVVADSAFAASIVEVNRAGAQIRVVGTTTPTNLGVQLPTYGGDNQPAWAGRYTLVFRQPTNLGVQPIPQGIGYATASVNSADGTLLLVGKTADRAPFSATLAADATNNFRLMAKPYGAGGYIGGWFQLVLTDALDDESPFHVATGAGGDIYWAKTANAKDTLYKTGFGPVGLDLHMEEWGGSSVTSIGASGVELTLVGTGISNALPNLNGLPTLATLRSSTVIGSTPTLANRVNLNLDATTGLFRGHLYTSETALVKGRFVTVKRESPLEGVLIDIAPAGDAQLTGAGFFLLPPLVKGGAITSGKIELRLPVPVIVP